MVNIEHLVHAVHHVHDCAVHEIPAALPVKQSHDALIGRAGSGLQGH